MAGRLNGAVEPNAGLPFHVVLPSIAFRSRKDAVPDFPHQVGHHPGAAVGLTCLGIFGPQTRFTQEQLRGPGLLVHYEGESAAVAIAP